MGVGSSHEWGPVLENLEAYNLKINRVVKSIGSSDHASFLNNRIPAIFFTTGTHDDYHRSSDDTARINFAALGLIGDLAFEVIQRADQLADITYNPDFPNDDNQGGNRGYGAHLGCVPEFGQGDEIVGVQCTKATVGSPAEAAGILPGDVLIHLGEIEIKNIYDLVFVLKFYRPGDRLELKWKRNGIAMSAFIVLAPSPRKSGDKRTP